MQLYTKCKQLCLILFQCNYLCSFLRSQNKIGSELCSYVASKSIISQTNFCSVAQPDSISQYCTVCHSDYFIRILDCSIRISLYFLISVWQGTANIQQGLGSARLALGYNTAAAHATDLIDLLFNAQLHCGLLLWHGPLCGCLLASWLLQGCHNHIKANRQLTILLLNKQANTILKLIDFL